jgi:hypothetical protein
VGGYDDGSAVDEAGQRLDDEPLGLRVEAGDGFVE